MFDCTLELIDTEGKPGVPEGPRFTVEFDEWPELGLPWVYRIKDKTLATAPVIMVETAEPGYFVHTEESTYEITDIEEWCDEGIEFDFFDDDDPVGD